MLDRLLVLDCETTSADPWTCRLVELALLALPIGPLPKVLPRPWVFRVDPGIPIPAEATEIHGITDDDVHHEAGFESYADDVQKLVDGAVLLGHNIRTFDSIVLDRELIRAGERGLLRDPSKPGKIVQPEIDTLQLWHTFEPRTLEGMLARFLGGIPDDFKAHSAGGDVLYLPDVVAQMAEELHGWPAIALQQPFDAPALEELARLSVPEGEVDRGGKFLRRADGVIVLNIGEHKGKAVMQVPRSFLEWMVKKDFPEDSKAVARWFLDHRSW